VVLVLDYQFIFKFLICVCVVVVVGDYGEELLGEVRRHYHLGPLIEQVTPPVAFLVKTYSVGGGFQPGKSLWSWEQSFPSWS
jgi:hypothetical protein